MKKTLSKQIHSFYYAIRGLFSVFVTEAHMRFHLIAAIYVLYFYLSFYNDTYDNSCLLLLILTIACVMVSEVLNTAIERMCDTITKEYNENIKFIKDVAAGTVLLFSIAATIIACFVFLDTDIILNKIFPYFTTNITALVTLIITAVISTLFVAVSPAKYCQAIRKMFSKSNK